MSRPIAPVPAGLLDPRVESLPPAPRAEQDFSRRLDGVIIPVWAGDVYLAKACCASVRQHMGEIPITLMVDGPTVDTREIQRLHGVQRILVQDIVKTDLLPFYAGTPWTKILLFWASPYERFLCLDADTVLWGDIRCYADFDQYDFLAGYNLHDHVLSTNEEFQRDVFDVEPVRKLNPTLNWQGREHANSGAFFARRGVFPQAQLMALRQLDCWRCYDQGLLNFLRWQAETDGQPRVGGRRFQIFPAEQNYTPENRFLPRDFARPVVVHWIGKKPKLGRPFRAANDYRHRFLSLTGRKHLQAARLFIEDLSVYLQRHRRSVMRRMKGQVKNHSGSKKTQCQ